VILLPLKKGINKLVVKYYNGFQKSTVLGIDNNVEQVYFKKTLKPLDVQKNSYYPFSWQLHKPYSPHTTMGLFNAWMELTTITK
jgi:alpha-L-fucosidase